jgi:hypothetical protein
MGSQVILLQRGRAGGFLFFKHIRKAGGTPLREYFSEVMKYHNNSRMFYDFVLSLDGDQVTKDLLRVFAKNEDRTELLKQHKKEWSNLGGNEQWYDGRS